MSSSGKIGKIYSLVSPSFILLTASYRAIPVIRTALFFLTDGLEVDRYNLWFKTRKGAAFPCDDGENGDDEDYEKRKNPYYCFAHAHFSLRRDILLI